MKLDLKLKRKQIKINTKKIAIEKQNRKTFL